MSGRPRLQKLAREIEAEAEKEGYDSGEDWIMDLIADGMPNGKIAEMLSKRFGYSVSRPQFQKWFNLEPERRTKAAAAREYAAWAHAEDSGTVLEDLHARSKTTLITSAEVSLAKERSNWKRWYAGKLNPTEFGDKASTEIHLHAGDLHLAALIEASRKAKAIGTGTAPAEDDTIEEAVVLGYEDGDDPLSDLR